VVRAVELSRARAEYEKIAIETHLPEQAPRVDIDERSIEVALLNLLDNAVKYAGKGGHIDVSLDRKGNYLRVCVSDHGPGIAAEDRRRIFERFVRGKQSGSTRGSGIGLALVRQIAVVHGGDAWVEPNEPQGARFVFTIPVAKGAEKTV